MPSCSGHLVAAYLVAGRLCSPATSVVARRVGYALMLRLESKVKGEVKPITPDDAYYIPEAASSVVVAPGYEPPQNDV